MNRALEIGKAGEHIVCADLILKGYKAFLSDQGTNFDIILDVNNTLLKLQVKTTQTYSNVKVRKYYTPAYKFYIRRCGKGGRRSYNIKEVDIFALICLEEMNIGYLIDSDARQSMNFRTRKYNYKNNHKRYGRYLEDYTIEKALSSILGKNNKKLNKEYYDIKQVIKHTQKDKIENDIFGDENDK